MRRTSAMMVEASDQVARMLELYVGNRNYSSWSLRPWLLMRQLDIGFTTHQLRLDWSDDSPFKRTLLAIAPTGRVPLLVDDGFPVWDSLAIAEYLADRFPERGVWPADPKPRARARALCAEMHAGFTALRGALPMNLEASLPAIGPQLVAERPDVAADVRRIDALVSEALAAGGGPFLFGAFGNADAYYAPVATRLRTYGLAAAPFVSPETAAWIGHVLALPAFLEWERAALAEHDFIEDDEPYRQRA